MIQRFVDDFARFSDFDGAIYIIGPQGKECATLQHHGMDASLFSFAVWGSWPRDRVQHISSSAGSHWTRDYVVPNFLRVHAPVKDNDCLVCHNPHGSDSDGLLAEGVPALCFSCHNDDAPFERAHMGFPVTEADCLACHDPHSSTLAKLIMPNQHAPFKGGRCSDCHETKSGATVLALASDVKSVCTRCHSAIRVEADKTYSHNLNDDRSCMNCHNAHASAGESLLSGAQQTLCTSCHFKTGEFADKSRASILTHDGMDCTNCHTPHGSENARYLKSTDVDLCTGCHERAHSSSHPIGPDVIDPRTGESLTCLSCHKLHGADFEPYLPLSHEMDLCIQCHKR